jgi:Queuosine salvage protein
MTQPPDTLGVLESVEAAIPLCRHVRIDEGRLAEVCAGIEPDELELPAWDFPVFIREDDDTLAGQILLFNAINFCYWGEPRWEVEYTGEWWDGALAMLDAIRRAWAEGIPLLEGAYLARLSEAEFEHILRGRARLHLMPERLAIWREVGRSLVAEFDGRFTNLIAAAGGDALSLVRLLVERFPSFDDVRTLELSHVRFYKRAQLAAAQLYEAFGGRSWGDLSQTDLLTVFADYKLPQVLRRMGIMVYDAELAATVDSEILIPAGDHREVEIRAATVWAAELMRRALVPRMPHVTALHLDYWLWYTGRDQGPGIKPYHRTLTTAY